MQSLIEKFPWVDTHQHFRGNYKSTFLGSYMLSRKYGAKVSADMPNNPKATTTEKDAIERFVQAANEGCKIYRINIGLTKDPKQVKAAAEAASKIHFINGLKYFTEGKLVVSIPNEDDRNIVYEALKECGYRGAVIPHCEDEALFKNVFDPNVPSTHNLARPIEAEESAVRKEVDRFRKHGLEGRLHIPHISSPVSLNIIEGAYNRGADVSGEVTPQHLLKSTEDMKGPYGLMLKMNPPIRSLDVQKALWERLKQISAPITIGSDNAPHTYSEKYGPPYMSGFQSIPLYPKLLEAFVDRGFTDDEIRDLTSSNAEEIFPKLRVI